MSFLTTPRLQVLILSSEGFIVLTHHPPSTLQPPQTIKHIEKACPRLTDNLSGIVPITNGCYKICCFIFFQDIFLRYQLQPGFFFHLNLFSFLVDRLGYLCWPSDRHTALQLGVWRRAINISRADYPFSHY